ncbi:MAG: hypothetical protein KI790_13360 [Cyclobacteriaceae bacterium]|nr:hypothetical protein [Cyclobacteriaceae bacterium HetDA_MAG_MS6]
MKFDITILTDHRYVAPTPKSNYVQNVFKEDGLIKKALEREGLIVNRKSWDDPTYDWENTRYALFRTTWDYFHRFDEFQQWLKQVQQKTTLINAPETIAWNMDKHYLVDLNKKGVNIAPTAFVEPETKTSLAELHERFGWKKSVLKPAIGGTARHTYLLNSENLQNHEKVFKSLLLKETWLLQAFQESILTRGEYSLMVIAGKYTHAVEKKPKKGDFRVQDDFGGSARPYHATPEMIRFAEMTVSKCTIPPDYARVDIFWDNDGHLALAELELIEPELWFRFNPEAANLLATQIVSRYNF